MEQTIITAQIDESRQLLTKLLNSSVHDIKSVARNKVESASVVGVYLISYYKNDEILYAGKNSSKTIYDRAWQHVNTPGTSNLKGMVKLYDDLNNDLKCYGIRWIEITDDRNRHFFEAFTMGVLRPRMNFK